MDKELIDLLNQKLFLVAKKDDLEKLRQEFHASIRKFKEEQKESLLKELGGLRVELEILKRDGKVDLEPVREEMAGLRLQVEGLLSQSLQSIGSRVKEEVATTLQPVLEERSRFGVLEEEIRSTLLQQEGRMTSSFNLFQEEEKKILHQSKEELRADLQPLREGVEDVKALVKALAGELTELNGRVRDGFLEVREELGAMIKFSYAELDRRITALEARVKALEKLVSP